MGVITGLLVSVKYLPSFKSTGLGDLVCSPGDGLVNIGRRMAHYPHGRKTAHETEATDRILRGGWSGGLDFAATFLKLPVSTTHVTAGAIAGVGAVQRVKAGALGSGFEYSVGLGFDDSRVGVVRLGV